MKSDWSADLKVKKSIHFKRAIRKENLQEISYQFCPEIISRVQNRFVSSTNTPIIPNIWSVDQHMAQVRHVSKFGSVSNLALFLDNLTLYRRRNLDMNFIFFLWKTCSFPRFLKPRLVSKKRYEASTFYCRNDIY